MYRSLLKLKGLNMLLLKGVVTPVTVVTCTVKPGEMAKQPLNRGDCSIRVIKITVRGDVIFQNYDN